MEAQLENLATHINTIIEKMSINFNVESHSTFKEKPQPTTTDKPTIAKTIYYNWE